MKPIINFPEKNHFRAFLMTSFVTAISAAISIELSYYFKLIIQDQDDYHFHLSLVKTFIFAFLASFTSFYLLYYLFGFGKGMIDKR